MGRADDFAHAVSEVVAAIPAGHVMSYGDVAAAIGSQSARGVGRVMAHSAGLPWWRVIRASGLPPAGLETAALEHYRDEETPLRWSADGSSYRVDVRRAGWFPGN